MELSEADLPYVTPGWVENYQAYLKDFSDGIGEDYLVKLWERGGFFLGDLAHATYERIFCMAHFGEAETRHLLQEPLLPRVTWHRDGYDLDPTALHHLYHLGLWEQQMRMDLRELTSVVEWGGGFGSFARLCMKRNRGLLYTIVDLPLFSAIQERYLAASGMHARHRSPSQMTEFAGELDLFVATWSLDESSALAQNLVQRSAFFGARHVLLAYHPEKADFPQSSGIPIPPGAELIEALPAGSYYAFR